MKNSKTKEQYVEAANLLAKAMEIFKEISRESPRDYDAAHFASEIAEMLSQDHGEAGLLPFIENNF